MVRYDTRILNGLLDSYENSLLWRGENKVHIHIAFPFVKKTMPEYFDESSLAYDEIHAAVRELEQKDFLLTVWKKGKEDHIIQKVILKEAKIEEVYAYLKRTPKTDKVGVNMSFLESVAARTEDFELAHRFSVYLKERIEAGKTVKEFIDLEDLEKTKEIMSALSYIEHNQESCYIREFSVSHFSDSKRFESLLGVLGKILRRFNSEFAEMDIYEILAEYHIYHTPNYVYVKGEGQLIFDEQNHSALDMSVLEHGIGISGADLKQIKLCKTDQIQKVITIENLTAFFRCQEEKSLLIYLGGYHNSVRRELLQMVYREIPDAAYLHFGDIDVGGFEIYRDLCEKTGIPFQTCHMGIAELERYANYTKKLTQNDKKRLKNLMAKKWPMEERIMPVLEYMEEHGVKLEQEIIMNIRKNL